MKSTRTVRAVRAAPLMLELEHPTAAPTWNADERATLRALLLCRSATAAELGSWAALPVRLGGVSSDRRARNALRRLVTHGAVLRLSRGRYQAAAVAAVEEAGAEAEAVTAAMRAWCEVAEVSEQAARRLALFAAVAACGSFRRSDLRRHGWPDGFVQRASKILGRGPLGLVLLARDPWPLIADALDPNPPDPRLAGTEVTR